MNIAIHKFDDDIGQINTTLGIKARKQFCPFYMLKGFEQYYVIQIGNLE